MGKVVQLCEVEIAALKPYERNAKKHSAEQIRKIGRSIQEMSFISPCLVDKDQNVIAGHGRIMAAREIGLEKVPCVFVEGLTEEQRRAYIIADNRLSEFSDWDMEKVAEELRDLKVGDYNIGLLDFDIETIEDIEINFEEAEDAEKEKEKHKAWNTRGVKCDMKLNIAARTKGGRRYISLYAVSKEGMTLEEIKNDRKCEKQMTRDLVDQITGSLGNNLTGTGWAMITTGRRRHREGYHFATEVTRKAAEKLRIPFYEGMITCENANRLKPDLKITTDPKEKNLIMFDDIITTGTTMVKTTELLQDHGYTVMTIIGIRNQ